MVFLIDFVTILSVLLCLSALWHAGCKGMAHSIPYVSEQKGNGTED